VHLDEACLQPDNSTDTDAEGIVRAARIPIMLTSRASGRSRAPSELRRLSSCSLIRTAKERGTGHSVSALSPPAKREGRA